MGGGVGERGEEGRGGGREGERKGEGGGRIGKGRKEGGRKGREGERRGEKGKAEGKRAEREERGGGEREGGTGGVSMVSRVANQNPSHIKFWGNMERLHNCVQVLPEYTAHEPIQCPTLLPTTLRWL